MKAMIIKEHGSVNVFEKAEIEKPTIKSGHVLIRVHATSVNPIDVKLRQKELPFSRSLPDILHGDVAGVVVEVAPNVKKLKVGDEVYGCCGGVKGTDGGALGEYMLADENLLALKPKNLSFWEAAALPLVAITSWEALHDKLKIQSGSSVLIHAGLGGVGHIAAQLAKYKGAVVHTTVSSDESFEKSKQLGADYPINYRTTSAQEYSKKFTDGQGFDFIFDTVGGMNLQNSFQAAKLNGSIACIATGGTHDLSMMYVKGISLHSVLMLIPLMTKTNREHYGNILSEVSNLVEEGHIRPLLDERVFGVNKISEAHALLESGQQTGKIVVKVYGEF